MTRSRLEKAGDSNCFRSHQSMESWQSCSIVCFSEPSTAKLTYRVRVSCEGPAGARPVCKLAESWSNCAVLSESSSEMELPLAARHIIRGLMHASVKRAKFPQDRLYNGIQAVSSMMLMTLPVVIHPSADDQFGKPNACLLVTWKFLLKAMTLRLSFSA